MLHQAPKRATPLSQLWSPVLLALCLATTLLSAGLGILLRRLTARLRDRAGRYSQQLQR